MQQNSQNQDKKKILKEYERKAEEIIGKMLQVLIRAQRKVDDIAYRRILEKIQKE